MSELLTLENIGVTYRNIPALRDVSLSVQSGQIVTVIGPNGAGKSTLLNATMGILRFTGSAYFDSSKLPPSVDARVVAGMSLVPEKRELFGTMTVEDNLLLGGYRFRHQGLRPLRVELERIYHLFPRLLERRTQQAGTLSGGERQMLAMGRALMSRPRLLMLDEPSLGLAPLIVRDIFRTIASLRDTGVGILLIEQNARAALQIADYGYVLETGQVTFSGLATKLAADSRVIELYLGRQTRGDKQSESS